MSPSPRGDATKVSVGRVPVPKCRYMSPSPRGDATERPLAGDAVPKSGPLHTGDLVGHDVNLAIMDTLYRESGDAKYRPHPLLKKMVRAGLLGQKTGKGFFTYDGPFGKEIPGGDLTIK